MRQPASFLAFLLIASCLSPSPVLAAEPLNVTFIIKGVHCDACVRSLRTSLAKVQGVQYNSDDIAKGAKPRYFSEPLVIKIADLDKTSIGALGEAIGKAKTPHRDDLEPRLNLVLYTSQRIDEDAVVALRSELMNVNGLEVIQPGGLGGFPGKGYFWVRLEPAGGADLAETIRAAKKAVPVTLKKE